ncbi:ATP-binding protein [Thermotoga sp.]|uniref:ATP-binding protein n=1 Tax=Thermotoga sp. TaxID=28240 RepID=UPI0025F421A3|nr:ATP-binding protein [Thermotoga sp.]MCD6552240.1 ATP-binding protein [Thermotoga sp.]
MEFIDREKELEYLNEEYKRPGSSFVVIYGRRRIGKTRLIKEFMKDKNGVYFLATEEDEGTNRSCFQQILYEKLSVPLLAPGKNLSWYDLFYILRNMRSKEKFVVAIDEFQYLVRRNKAITSVFQKIWDELLKDDNFFLILCGSSLSLMEKEVLSYSSPLYGRRTGQIKLKPISFEDFKRVYNGTAPNPVEHYSLIGGVPKYMELLSVEGDIYRTIERNFLNTSSFFFEEPYFLLGQEVKEIGTYFSLMKAIAMGNRKLGKIATVMGVAQHKLSYYLSRLVDIGLLEREVPVTERSPEKSKSGLYRIKDYFLDFWFKYIYPYRSYIEIGQTGFVINVIKKTFRERHVSFVYEDICREKVVKMNSKGELPVLASKVGKWWKGEDEIDIVGVDSENRVVLLGECKYTGSQVDVDLYYKLVERSRRLNVVERPVYIFFSFGGFTKDFVQKAKENKSVFLFEGY